MNCKKIFGISARAIRRWTSRRRWRSTSVGRRRRTWQKAGLLFFVCECLMCARPTESVDVCIPEHFLYTPKEGPDICQKCYPGTFMPHHLHKYRQCFECSQIQDPQLEILVSPCNLQQDTEIHCVNGYFRIKAIHPDVKGRCQKCKTCPFPKGPCSTFTDTICCPGDDYAVRVTKEGNPECVRLCGAGQFLDPTIDQCLPCPTGTFMHEDKHTHIYCWNCNVPGTDHEVIVQRCTSTKPAIIGCKEGYYQRSISTYPFDGCVRCQMCSESTTGHVYEVRPCNVTHNTVCGCPPDMIEVDTPGGPQCQHPRTAAQGEVFPTVTEEIIQIYIRPCGRHQYLNIESEGRTAACLPCPEGTCMSEDNHLNTNCQTCADLQNEMEFDSQAMVSDNGPPATWRTADFTMTLLCSFLSSVWFFF